MAILQTCGLSVIRP